ncbi:Diaminopimelate epimerase-like protein [Macrolepiota fuliginosa MF-IS2]|uniref:Diaminopimelate epimerase-like protein n=1 Tax=Macrolepiota fuliginosa MF-IS2 TaxID=1400762 RepID=A0A9P6C3J3_9AGAR|nr:Diaminopimelate epimerase-like protein [Macrolepiota fuliginosa MF-IS2]
MAYGQLEFHILDVFTTTKYMGNPLAIVQVPASVSASLTQEKKQLIAREFNLSETVFIHANSSYAASDAPLKIDIFTTEEEIPFAGHPTVGSSWFLLLGPGKTGQIRQGVTLKTKAGNISAVLQGGGRVRLQVPVDFGEHAPFHLSLFKSAQSRLHEADYANGLDGAEPVVSIVKGMTFVLLKLNSEDALKKLRATAERVEVPWLGEWQGLVALYAFYERDDRVLRTRMFLGALEDPATGSAASALGGYLGKRKGPGKWRFEIVQGVEMGRRSDIEVQVDIGSDGEIERIELGGGAVKVIEGSISL